ncbi:hypothetical protein LTR99_005264 [Exophiala xenobiotica]|uniref:RGS domain-containing protein n=1 Tax=Vermiconidia calcicola TaxID=1690605 RepID=A0AAV9QA66_9PEZI|nr:hypothetical protein LTR92_004021 [Exophiala xenobiotica]KAK5535978.1 hypothetical protein LTR25_005880 [Vermiconidia calcicola]KAK5270822.1 hypothetical protein LTR96_004100 [Exophiala xenobiotica]KAK5303502.1 hypothetical protein LTR99_005264 [Exophiala xenobiotica]KAK5339712.1 hypothetical protein LTR98_004514 [Exophiala xenobiotica]
MASPPPCTGALPRNVDNGLDRGTDNVSSAPFALKYDMALRYNTDGLGFTYVGIVIAWTCLLLPASIFLIRNRHLPFLRMRNIPLAISAVAVLHVYWVLCMIAYVLNGFFPCSTEYWIMSIYLPLGIALFQASNSQLFSIATAQKRYLKGDVAVEARPAQARGWRKYWQKVKTYNTTKNTMAWIGIAMMVQLAFSLIVFLVSRKFHPSFGVTGVVTTRAGCRRGWEWWPSIVWQIFWSWIYAPVLLWRVRNIHDVHGWRKQTVACIVAGLPASPMWLIALYAKGMQKVDTYFVPPLWFSASIVIMQGSVVFVPFFHVFKNRRLETETREIIAEWEDKQKGGGSFTSSGSTKVVARSRFSTRASMKSNTTTTARQGEMYTMGALEKTLQLNPQPLLVFSALKDFSGENISFLIHVREWKAKWNTEKEKPNMLRKQSPVKRHDQALIRQQFNQAVGIYASFVSLKYSNFPINISSAHLRELEAMFEQYAALVCAEPASNAVTPFESYWSSTFSDDLESQAGRDQLSVVSTVVSDSEKNESRPESAQARQLRELTMSNFGERLPANIGIPDIFDATVFDKAEMSIKELVLTNTWAKFVKAGFAQNAENPGFATRFRAAMDTCRQRLPKLTGKWRK